MLDWLKRRFSKPEWDLSTVVAPWSSDVQSLAAFIEDSLDEEGMLLADSGIALPDADRVAAGQGVRFAAGARDGIAIFHLATVDDDDVGDELITLIRAVLADGGLAVMPQLYAGLVTHRALTWVDQLGPGVAADPQPDPNRLYALGLYLATQAPDREAVKAGMAMLSLLDLTDDDLGVLRLLGSHDEFALFAVVGLTSQSDDPDQELWSLAERITGWGRVHAVQRLADSDDPQIQAWLLRHGFRNDVMDRYLALACAIGGDLAAALAEDQVDDELFDGATALLMALLEDDGPMPGMDAWEDGAAATSRWLDHLAARTDPALGVVPLLGRIVQLAEGDRAPWQADAASALGRTAAQLLANPTWRQRTLEGLGKTGPAFSVAVAAAGSLGLDTFDAWLRHLSADDPIAWYGATAAAGPDRLALVLDRARDLLPDVLVNDERNLTGAPETALGQILSTLLAAVAECPGRGGEHVLQGLRSPVVQHRNLALRTLMAWPQHTWPDGAHERVAELAMKDPEASVRASAASAWGDTAEA